MDEREIRSLVEDVKAGKLPRRRFVQMMVGLGLTAPMAAQMLSFSGIAHAQSVPPYKPRRLRPTSRPGAAAAAR